MKTHVYFDQDGTIRSFVIIRAPKGAGMMLAAGPGIRVAEVKGMPDMPGDPDIKVLHEFAAREKVDLPVPVWTARGTKRSK